MKTLVINITMLMSWNRYPVGMVRVESELARYLLDHYSNKYLKFCVYDEMGNVFVNINHDVVRDKLGKLYCEPKINANKVIINESKIHWKIYLKKQLARIINTLPIPEKNKVVEASLRFRKLYREYFLVPKYYINKYLITLKKLKKNNNILQNNHAREQLAFASGNVFISMGNDWDYLDFSYLYEQKNKMKFYVIYMCYDLIPIQLPHLCLDSTNSSFSRYLVDLLWCSDKVLCISKNTKNDLNQFIINSGAHKPDMSVIRLGDNIPIAGNKIIITNMIKDIIGKKYILYVSSVERRKNHEILYKSYVRAYEMHVSMPIMVFIGMPGWGTKDLLRDIELDPRIKGQIIILPNISDPELMILYSNCLFSVYPSIYEGWGLPIIESLSYGKFCLSSSKSSLPEAGGRLVEYIDPWDLCEWMNKIHYYSNNYRALSQKEAYIRDNFKPYKWELFGMNIINEVNKLT